MVPQIVHLYQVPTHNLAQLEHLLVADEVDTAVQVVAQLQVAMVVQVVVRHILAVEIVVQ